MRRPVDGRPARLTALVLRQAGRAERRFPPPWSVEETNACFIVRDANGARALACVYFEEVSGRSFCPVPDPPTMAREAEEEWNKARPRRGLSDMDQKAFALRSPKAR